MIDQAQVADPGAPAGGVAKRDLRLDLFRGLALWLIFIDHLPPNMLNWFTLRNYGFSDATEIFIFISGYTAAFVYGRAMQERGFVVASHAHPAGASGRSMSRMSFCSRSISPRSPISRSRFENPLYAEEMNILDFLKQPDVTIVQALLLRFRPVNMDVLPLYIVLMVVFPPVLWLLLRKADLALALSVVLYAVAWNLRAATCRPIPAASWFFNPFAWQLLFVFGAWWRSAGGAARMSPALVLPDHPLAWGLPILLFSVCVALTWYVP